MVSIRSLTRVAPMVVGRGASGDGPSSRASSSTDRVGHDRSRAADLVDVASARRRRCGSAATCASPTTRPCSTAWPADGGVAAAVRARPGPVGAGRARRAGPTSPRSLRALDASLRRRALRVASSRRPGATVVPRPRARSARAAVHVAADFGPYGRRRDARSSRPSPTHGIELVRTGSPYAVAPGRVTNGRRRRPTRSTRRSRGLGRARLARPGRRPDRRRAGWRSTEPTAVPDPDAARRARAARGRRGGGAAAVGGVPSTSGLADYDDDRDRPDLDGTSPDVACT